MKQNTKVKPVKEIKANKENTPKTSSTKTGFRTFTLELSVTSKCNLGCPYC